MGFKWKNFDFLAAGESSIYKCELEEEDGEKISVILTNYRIIWGNNEFMDSKILKHIVKFGIFEGYDEYVERDDNGAGEFGIYFGDVQSYDTFWFYSKEVWKNFYEEFSRTIIENL